MSFDSYQFETTGLYFKHELSKHLPCSAYAKHAHKMFELLYFVGGDATQIIEDRKHKLKEGDRVLIPPFKYHFIQIDSPSDYERYDILFDEHLVEEENLSWFFNDADVINLNNIPLARGVLQKTDYYYQNLAPDDFLKVMTHLLSELFYILKLTSCKSERDPFVATSPALSKALHYINKNLTTLSDLGEVAEHCFVSDSYLFRLFKKELHQTPKKYINNKRLLLAQSKLVNGEKPTMVYASCGFSDYTTFYRNYIDFFGYPPSKTQPSQ